MRFVAALVPFLLFSAPALSQVMEDRLLADSLSTSENYGKENALWISGNLAFVGDPDDNGGRGAVNVFKRSNQGTWNQVGKLQDATALPGDGFGWSVEGDGKYLIVGAIYGDDPISGTVDTGAAFIYDITQPSAPPTRLPIPAGYSVQDMFGFAVDVCSTSSPPIAIVGAPRTDGVGMDEGTVETYQFNGLDWVHQTTFLTATGTGSLFGRAVGITATPSLPGEVEIIIGAPGGGVGDAVFYHAIVPGAWSMNTILSGPGSTSGDGFGINVSIDEDFAAIGAYTEDVGGFTKVGAAYVYKRGTLNWDFPPDLRVEGVAQEDWFGLDVSLVKTGPETALLAVGIEQSDTRGLDAGEIKVWERTGPSSWAATLSQLPVYGESGWRFGSGVALGIEGSRRLLLGGAREGREVQVIDLDRDSATFTGRVSISPRITPGTNTFKTYGVDPGNTVQFMFGTNPGNTLYDGCITAFSNPTIFCTVMPTEVVYGEASCDVLLSTYSGRLGIQAVEYLNAGACLSISDFVIF